jgi:hypothetical protein
MKKKDTKGDDSPRKIAPPERPPEARAGSRGKGEDPKRPHVKDAPPAHMPGKKQKNDNAGPPHQPQQKQPAPAPVAKRPDPAPRAAPAAPQIQPEKGKGGKPKKADPEEDDKKPRKGPK